MMKLKHTMELCQMPGIVNITTIYNIFVADTEAEVLEFIEEEGLTLEDPELT
jgi:hypothetical protein